MKLKRFLTVGVAAAAVAFGAQAIFTTAAVQTATFDGITVTHSGRVNPTTAPVIAQPAFKSVEFSTGPSAFEFAAVPEPSTWAMLAFWFGGLAFAGFRTRRSPISIV
jgi:hypothetical protein